MNIYKILLYFQVSQLYQNHQTVPHVSAVAQLQKRKLLAIIKIIPKLLKKLKYPRFGLEQEHTSKLARLLKKWAEQNTSKTTYFRQLVYDIDSIILPQDWKAMRPLD